MRRFRRFVGFALLLTIAAYVAWGRFEMWRLKREIGAIEARGEPIDYSYWDARQVTAEQREAARLYARAAEFATDAESGQPYRASMLDVDKPGGPVVSLEDMAAAYRPDAPAMQLLDRATPLDFTEFGAANRELSETQFPLQRLGAQACLRADLVAVLADGEAAVSALVPCLRLQRTLLPDYRSQHAERLLGSFRILFRHTSPSDRSLAELQRGLATWPEEDGAVRGLLQDRVRFLSYIDAPSRSFGELVVTALTRPFLTSVTRRRLVSYDEALRLARLPWKARQEAFAEIRRQPMPRRPGFLAAFFAPQVYFGVAYFRGTPDLAVRRMLLSVLAVERYRRANRGAVPAGLDALVPAYLSTVPEDPYSGQPIVYRRERDGYIIYSVDSNKRDDGGALYGHGAAVAQHVGPQSPRDLGIRVPLKPGDPGTKGPRD